ncbi:MAG TPA: sensor domain-containing diguanylate cyclase [Pyrinomonadaceae bacterium]|jgi:diguanylate cyclase (GGDEF)-like protein|nr:sensor domain-containing diguanylate cyclase [Pyrinomonadaceae bacterium]
MPRHVILLTDAHEAPAYELIEALRLAGVQTLIEGLRDVEAEAALIRRRETENVTEQTQEAPLAVLYEVVAGADMVELHAAIDHAKTFWPGTPVIACRRHAIGFHGFNARGIDGATLKRLGFRAIADKAAQLPAILHEIEGHGATGELRLPATTKQVVDPGTSLPAKMKAASLRAAFDLVSSLHFIGDQSDAAQVALTGLTALAKADRWTIYMLADEKGPEAATLEAIASLAPGDKVVPELNDDWRQVLLAGDAIVSIHESKAAKLAGAGMGTIRKKERGEFVIALPLICGERILGVLEGRRERRAYKKSEVALLDALSLPIASALANAVRIGEAERLSQTDDLTKLHNARYLRQFLLNEIRRARRYGTSVCALFLDLDDFKRVNDEHGHLAGSHVLMEMAGVILSSIRDTDAVARYGGDEFVIVLPDTGIELAGTVAERIRDKISKHSFNAGRNLKLSLTASFGVAAFPEHASSPQQLISSADTAMYEAKAANKNCVRFSPLLRSKEEKLLAENGVSKYILDADEGKAFS